jgi:hypothetical protein
MRISEDEDDDEHEEESPISEFRLSRRASEKVRSSGVAE